MSVFGALDVSATGMTAQQLRMVQFRKILPM